MLSPCSLRSLCSFVAKTTGKNRGKCKNRNKATQSDTFRRFAAENEGPQNEDLSKIWPKPAQTPQKIVVITVRNGKTTNGTNWYPSKLPYLWLDLHRVYLN